MRGGSYVELYTKIYIEDWRYIETAGQVGKLVAAPGSLVISTNILVCTFYFNTGSYGFLSLLAGITRNAVKSFVALP